MGQPIVIGIAGLIEILRPYAELILPMVFCGFFLLSALAVIFSDRQYVTKSYLAGFLIVLLLFQTVIPITISPFINWHKFSEPKPIESTEYEIRVVDANGQEIKVDEKALLAHDGIYPLPAERLVSNESSEEDQEIARWLLDRTNTYRTAVERGHPTRGTVPSDVWNNPRRLYRFPAHSSGGWTAEELSGYSEFVGIRVYQVRTVTSTDGTEITSRSEELVLELYPERGADNATRMN
ncbi:hypothetical protein DJ82_09260 [Halorubrum sp. Ib24]|nr:hypothetical protein DJ82_09260 [Halorubrum sp. Ib24]